MNAVQPEQLVYKPKQELRRSRMAAGLCRDCGEHKPMKGKVICGPCGELRSKYGKNRTKKCFEQGLCTQCGNKHDRGKYLCAECSQRQIEEFKLVRKRNKEVVIAFFGGKCQDCNESDIHVLTLHHSDNDGAEDCRSKKGNRISSTTWYGRLYKSIKNNIPITVKLELLCFNCHFKKDLSPWWCRDE